MRWRLPAGKIFPIMLKTRAYWTDFIHARITAVSDRHISMPDMAGEATRSGDQNGLAIDEL